MMTTIETYVRRGQGSLRKWAVTPGFRQTAELGLCALSGTALSAASLAGVPQPLAMGLVCALSGFRALAAALGGAVGYWFFWGAAGIQGLWWMRKSMGLMSSGHLVTMMMWARWRLEAGSLSMPIGIMASSYIGRL